MNVGFTLDMFQLIKDGFTAKIQQVTQTVDQCSQNCAEFTNTKCNELKVQYNKMNTQVESVSKTASQQADLVDEFVNRELQRDLPTGKCLVVTYNWIGTNVILFRTNAGKAQLAVSKTTVVHVSARTSFAKVLERKAGHCFRKF